MKKESRDLFGLMDLVLGVVVMWTGRRQRLCFVVFADRCCLCQWELFEYELRQQEQEQEPTGSQDPYCSGFLS